MPTSVRSLWTAALVLSMGCQAVPSQSTDRDGSARALWSRTRSSKHASPSETETKRALVQAPSLAKIPPRLGEVSQHLWRIDMFDSSSDDVDRSAETRRGVPSGVERSNASLSTHDQTESAPPPGFEHEGIALQEGPQQFSSERSADESTSRSKIDLAASDPADDAHAHRSAADSFAAFAHREGSLFDDIRNRVARNSRSVEAPPQSSPSPDGPFYERPSTDIDTTESRSSPVITMGVEADSRSRRDGREVADVPLEAPTPLSSVTRQTVLIENLTPLRPQDADVTGSTAENEAAAETEQGFVSSFFDKFGIGAERTRNRDNTNAEIFLRESGLSELQRPLEVDKVDRSAPAEEFLAPLQTLQWQEELDRLTTLLETQLASQSAGDSAVEQDYYLRQQVALRLLYLINSRRAEALQAIPNCDRSQQEFWTAMLWTLSNIFDEEAMPDRSHRARETAAQLRVALEHLAPLAGLQLAKGQFCRQIDGFGSYETFERDEFSPGQSVLIYAEVQNFLSELTSQNEYLTVLQSTLTIRQQSLNDRVVFHQQLPPTEDRCRSRRSDYFHSYRVKLPQDLTPGSYVLTLTVRDRLSHKEDTVSLNFVIRAVQ